jgi:hypothetical protein
MESISKRGIDMTLWYFGLTYTAVNDILCSGIVIDIHRHPSKGRDFRGQLIEARVVLPVRFISMSGSSRRDHGVLLPFALVRI